MALFLLHAREAHDRNSSQMNSCLVEAATEQDARDAAQAAAPNGEVRVRDSWVATNLGAGEFPDDRTVCWFQGRGPVSLLGKTTGGNRIA